MDTIKNIRLEIDKKEQKIITHFEQYEYVSTKILDVGDLIFFKNDQPILIIERKTVNDLNASIIDGRYREQKHRLFKTNCPFIYLIEGNIYCHKNKSRLIGSLCNLLFRDNIKIIKTSNIKESIDFIEKLSIKFNKNDFDMKPKEMVNYRIKKKDCYNIQDCFKLQLNLIPGVSINMAKTISEKYKTLNNLITFLKENDKLALKDVEYPTTSGKFKKINVKMSEKIYNYLVNG
jgi:ERCC4-type nuclease